LYQPISENCTGLPDQNNSTSFWPENSVPVLRIPLLSKIVPRPRFVPAAIPRDLSERLTKFHGQPSIWWISKLSHFIFRAKPETEKMLEEVQFK
jgi:glycoprotein 6-alpha-L-fucosyltransferase